MISNNERYLSAPTRKIGTIVFLLFISFFFTATARVESRKLNVFSIIIPLFFSFHCISQDDEEDDLEEIPPGSPPRLPGAFVPDQFTLCSSSSDLSTPLNPNTHNFRLRNSKTIRKFPLYFLFFCWFIFFFRIQFRAAKLVTH